MSSFRICGRSATSTEPAAGVGLFATTSVLCRSAQPSTGPSASPSTSNAGSFTAADHLAVLTATFSQIPAPWRTDVLVSIDCAGASHDVIDYLTSVNTAARHGRRGRRVEYSIGWPVDDRTLAAIEQLRHSDRGAAMRADGDGDVDPAAEVTDLTGIMRHGPGGDRLATWPADMRFPP